MNRGAHLRETLPVNIMENCRYPNIEFIVLDYNSGDGLEEWGKTNWSDFTDAGILKYYKTYDPEYFDRTHSRNMTIKLASGDICCMVDADNYAGPGFASWVDSIFADRSEKFVLTTLRKDHIPYRDQGGKICFRKDHVLDVSGYDESFVGYGMDDVDVVNRLEKSGGKRVYIEDDRYLRYISHSNADRLKNHYLPNNLEHLYLLDSGGSKTKNAAIYLLKDNRFFEAQYEFSEPLKSNQILTYGGWMLKQNGHRKGVYYREGGILRLVFEDSSMDVYRELDNSMVRWQNGKECSWKKVPPDNDVYYSLVMGYGECLNRLKYLENELEKRPINVNGWGKGTVYLNFDRSKPIVIE